MALQNPSPQTTSLSHVANRQGSFFSRVGAAFDAFAATMFGPGTPPAPSASTQEEGPRDFRYAAGYNLNYTPRAAEGLTPYASLIALAENYDIARICITYWCEQIASLDWEIVPARAGASVDQGLLDAARAFLEKPDGVHTFADWIAAAVDEVLTTDALSIFPQRDRVGRVLWFDLVDGSTIVPKADARGRIALPPGIAYQQVLYGVPWWEGTRDELLYYPKNRRTRSLYGRAPTEDLVVTINRALRRQTFDLAYYTVGNEPEALVTAPKDMTADQIRDFQLWWDEMMSQPVQRRRMRFVPGGDGFTVHEFKEPLKDTAVEVALATTTLARYGVPPQEVGLTADVNKATSSGQENVQFRRRLPYLRYFAAIFTDMLQLGGFEGVRLQFSGQVPEEDKLAQAKVDEIYVRIGVTHPDAINERNGNTAAKVGTIPAVYTAQGPVPVLTQAILDEQKADQAQAAAAATALLERGDPAAPGEEDDDAAEEDGGGTSADDAEEDDDVDVNRLVHEVRANERYTAKGRQRRPFEWELAPGWVRRLTPVVGHRHMVAMLRSLEQDRVRRAGNDSEELEDDGEDDTVPSHRDRITNGFALALTALLSLLQAGTISEAQYAAYYQEAWTGSTGELLERIARDTGADVGTLGSEIAGRVSTLTGQANASAAALGADIAHRGREVSDAMRAARAVDVAGSLWAIGQVATGAGHRVANPLSVVYGRWDALDDDRVSDDCSELDGQEWTYDEIPQFPGDGGTDCGGMCRCEIEYRLEDVMDRSEADTEDVDVSA